jgi:hypothetical protein
MKILFRPSAVIAICLLVSASFFLPSAASASSSGSAAAGDDAAPGSSLHMVDLPGPINSFLRMAGISQEITPADVLPLLARNAFLYGHIGERRTEYLVLVDRYLQQARELRSLASGDGMIRVSGCNDVGPLIQILGYKFENGCTSKDASLVTADAEKAFLTVDSGFPLTRLEQSLQEGVPFAFAFPATRVPVYFQESDWVGLIPTKQRTGSTVLDILTNNESADRLYSGLSRLDSQTRRELYQSPGLRRLLFYGPVLDFYGSRICIHDGVVDVPGGAAAEHSWQELVGASPRSPSDFVLHLLAKDQGWTAAYFDALSRVSPDQQAHLVQGDRLRSLYQAYRSAVPVSAAATSVFPRNADLLLLLTRLQWDSSGQLEVPGNLDLWRDIFARREKEHRVHSSVRHVSTGSPDQLLEALVAYTNVLISDGPPQVYLKLSAIDAARPRGKGLSVDTARLLSSKYEELNAWYSIFVEFPGLDDASITDFINTASHITQISNPVLRSNALGALQAEVGIWQILARQQQIPIDRKDASWEAAIKPYDGTSSSNDLFDAARKSLESIVASAGGNADLTQDEVVDLLAGPTEKSPEALRVHEELVRRIRSVLDDQRLASLDTLFGLYDGLGKMAHGADIGDSLLPLAGTLREFEMPRPIFSEGERATWSPTVYVSRHAELQVRTDLAKVIRGPSSPPQLDAARARLAPFLRDTLVGLNYAYYEPPGAQVLHANPLFVRSHDFAASSIQGVEEIWQAPSLIGIGATAGGGAYLIGSLADLPYVLALTEEDFISPEKIQALIWKEAVPELLVDAILPRWWGVTQQEMHAADLYQRAGEELLSASASNAGLRKMVIDILSERMDWGRVEEIQEALQDKDGSERVTERILPAEVFYLEAQFRNQHHEQAAEWGPASQELQELSQHDPADTSPERLSRDFGVPHPTLAETDTLALLPGEPFPVSGGYASRLFGESWESSNLYWARLADEKGYAPAALNLLVPELTRQMVANISATSIDDWPALLRAMTQTGQEFLNGRFPVNATGALADNKEIVNGGSHGDE